MKKTAILIGATGLTGGFLLRKLAADSDFETITIFGRSATDFKHPKIEEHLIDMFQLADYAHEFKGDVVFCCIGTTQAKTPNRETYKKIDYGIPVAAAELTKKADIKMFQVISAMGASTKSSSFYNKTKGAMERDVLAQKVNETYIFQPSLLGGKRSEKRFGEQIAQIAMNVFSFAIPKRYKIIEPVTIAEAMLKVAKKGFSEVRITSDIIKEIAEN